MSKYKKLAMIMCSIGLMFLITGITYAYFNYTKTTGSQQLIAGDIYFKLNEGNDEIELSNIFPETKEEARSRDDNYITFSVNGKNTSNKTVYYEFILDHGEDKASPKSRYNDEDLRFDLVELDSNGNEVSYLLDAVSYDTLINKKIFVDTVEANTTIELTRYYKLRMWLDEKIIISDTLPDASYSSIDYPNKYTTIKLKVFGDFNEKDYSKSLYAIMKKGAIMDNINSTYVNNETPGIDFSKSSSDTNGKGIYMRAGTENNTYPIMYYRGNVENNNVIFGDFCWKAVRSTDTGGVKLLYNGLKKSVSNMVYNFIGVNDGYGVISNIVSDENYGFEYDEEDKIWKNKDNYYLYNASLTISFTQSGNYIIKYNIIEGYIRIKKNGVYVLNYNTDYDSYFLLENINANDQITIESYEDYETELTIQIADSWVVNNVYTCDNSGANSQITINNSNRFKYNLYANSPAYLGYMYGDVYSSNYGKTSYDIYFGNSFTYSNGLYTLTDAKIGIDSSHHYTCNLSSASGTCATIRFYYKYDTTENNYYYINLTDGNGVEEAIERMNVNTNDSHAKTKIESWYAANMIDYTDNLEDPVWCNDRNIRYIGGWSPTSDIVNSTRISYGTFSVDLNCQSKNDSFTWKNDSGNKKLNYPVGLLTDGELRLSGLENSYTVSGIAYWTMSPREFSDELSSVFTMGSSYMNGYQVDFSYGNGLRPAISIKSSNLVSSGDGTANDPYVIE